MSHARADKWLATVLCEKIEAAGAVAFRDDRDIDGGDDIPERIRSEIKKSRELVVLLTPYSIDRPWVLFEVGAAWGWSRNIRITAVLYHVDVDPIPKMLKPKKAIDINSCDALFAQIRERVERHHDKA